MAFQQKRRTQTPEYWVDEFAVHKEDVEYLYEWLVEENEPRTLDQLGAKLVERRCQREELALAKGGTPQAFVSYSALLVRYNDGVVPG